MRDKKRVVCPQPLLKALALPSNNRQILDSESGSEKNTVHCKGTPLASVLIIGETAGVMVTEGAVEKGRGGMLGVIVWVVGFAWGENATRLCGPLWESLSPTLIK